MAAITVRVDPEVKKLMEKYSHIDWSEVVRRAILEELEREERRNIAEALLINERLRRKAPRGWDSTRAIKRWRRER